MSSINKVILIGNLGADPEQRSTQGGVAVTNFRVATSESFEDREGNKQERTEWTTVVAWGKLGELCGKYLARGRKVYVEGKLQTRKWQDRAGADRYSTEVVAREVLFLDSRGQSGSNTAQAAGRDDDVMPF